MSTLALNSEALMRAFSRSSDMRRKWAAVYLLERVQRACEHEYRAPHPRLGNGKLVCPLCDHETEISY